MKVLIGGVMALVGYQVSFYTDTGMYLVKEGSGMVPEVLNHV